MGRADDRRHAIFVIGAARSGTKLLRKIVALHGSIAEIPFDINYVWRMGAGSLRHDAFPADHADPHLRETLWSFFSKFQRGEEAIVEKTVGNSMRVAFVHRLFPNAKFIFLFRDGMDVAASSLDQWRRRPRTGMLWPKLRTFPWWQARGYAWDYVRAQAGRLMGVRDSVESWGPVYPGMEEDVGSLPLAAVCAKQWRECVNAMLEQGRKIPPEQLLEIRYEDFVCHPEEHGARLASFIDRPSNPELESFLNASVSSSNVGKWKQTLHQEEVELVQSIVEPTRRSLGYASSSISG